MSCAACSHAKLHHGHFGPVGVSAFSRWSWIDERRCWVWVAPLGRKKSGGPCPCKGWSEEDGAS